MKEIQLTQGKVAVIDDEDFEQVSMYHWRATRVKNRFYAARYIKPEKGKYRIELLHRFIMKALPGQQVDHIDGDGLNCTRLNMRFATNVQNQHNRGKHRDNTSGYKGVNWMKGRQRWRARIMVNRREIHIGLFYTAIEAAIAYDEAALKYHGAFARLNFTPETQ